MSDVKKIRVKFYFNIFLCLISIGISEPVKLDSIKFEDKWLTYDKVQHFTFSFLWTLSSQYILVNSMNIYEQDALTFSVFSSFSTGIMKETYDMKRPNGYFSNKDMVANTLGIFLAVMIINENILSG